MRGKIVGEAFGKLMVKVTSNIQTNIKSRCLDALRRIEHALSAEVSDTWVSTTGDGDGSRWAHVSLSFVEAPFVTGVKVVTDDKGGTLWHFDADLTYIQMLSRREGVALGSRTLIVHRGGTSISNGDG